MMFRLMGTICTFNCMLKEKLQMLNMDIFLSTSCHKMFTSRRKNSVSFSQKA